MRCRPRGRAGIDSSESRLALPKTWWWRCAFRPNLELWGTLSAYNLIRLGMAKAALTAKCDPTGISFIRAFDVIQYELRWVAMTRVQGKLPALLKRLRQRLVDLLNEERPGQSSTGSLNPYQSVIPFACSEETLTERH